MSSSAAPSELPTELTARAPLGFRRMRQIAGSGPLAFGGLVLLSLALAACSQEEPQPQPNVVLIVIDTLRADRLGAYGCEPSPSPFLDRLAQRGVVCDPTRSTSSWTAPATASLMTSLYPDQHGVHTGFLATRERDAGGATLELDRIPADITTLAEVFQGAGYQTLAVTDNRNICHEMGFDQGFDAFHNLNNVGARAVNAQVMAWKDRLRGERPYLLYLHYMDPHRPYQFHGTKPEPSGDPRTDQLAAYDSEIGFVDARIRELYEALGWDQNTVLVVTADHGEEFQDHGGWDHGRTLYHEVIDVPLIWSFPGKGAPAGRWSGGASLLDVLPTLRGYLGLGRGEVDQGINLFPLMRDRALPPERPLFAQLHSPPWFGSKTLDAVLQDSHKLILDEPTGHELYDLFADPTERQDLFEGSPHQAESLQNALQAAKAGWKRWTPAKGSATLNDQQLQNLRALGY
ncbi:MAG: sulfatase [Planctomycetes bacterium]|nr:sulfatase [Planctomycetota bacterium]